MVGVYVQGSPRRYLLPSALLIGLATYFTPFCPGALKHRIIDAKPTPHPARSQLPCRKEGLTRAQKGGFPRPEITRVFVVRAHTLTVNETQALEMSVDVRRHHWRRLWAQGVPEMRVQTWVRRQRRRRRGGGGIRIQTRRGRGGVVKGL